MVPAQCLALYKRDACRYNEGKQKQAAWLRDTADIGFCKASGETVEAPTDAVSCYHLQRFFAERQ